MTDERYPRQTEDAGIRTPGRLPQIGTLTLTCADCGTSWMVTPSDIVIGDNWIKCPTCTAPNRSAGQSD